MKLLEWLKRKIAKKEMAKLEQWEIRWHEHRRWFAEFQVTATALDHMKANVDGEPVTNIHTVRDSCRAMQPAPLTDEQMQKIWWDCGLGKEGDVPASQDELMFARAIEAAIKGQTK